MRPISQKGRCRLNKVSDFIKENGNWDIELLQEFFIPADVQIIRGIRTSPSQDDDFLSWFPGKFGKFCVKSAYHLAMQEHIQKHGGGACSSRPEGDRPCWNLVWQARVPSKMRSFVWKVLVDALPTSACMVRHHIPVSASCRMCAATDDSSYHALVICPKSHELWEVMRQVWPLPAKEQILDTGKEWLFSTLQAQNEDV